ncbi:hypothetical protein ACB092_01G281200 [Castanea dentata]
MLNLTKLEFAALDISSKNYLSWTLDAEIHLEAKNLGDTIKERYENKKSVIFPKAHYNWLNLRFQDFESVSEYNSTLFKIISLLKLCGEKITDEDILEKTFTTFHASNILLQQQYRERKFTKYSELISCLLVAKQNNELLLKNHQSHPTDSTPFPEANGTSFDKHRENYVCGHGRGRGRNNQYRKDRTHNSSKMNNTPYHQKNQNGKGLQNKLSNGHENKCYRRGMEGYWSRTCCTPKHLVDLYQTSIKEKGKGIETNFVDHNDLEDPMNYLDLSNGVDMHIISLILMSLISLRMLMENLII